MQTRRWWGCVVAFWPVKPALGSIQLLNSIIKRHQSWDHMHEDSVCVCKRHLTGDQLYKTPQLVSWYVIKFNSPFYTLHRQSPPWMGKWTAQSITTWVKKKQLNKIKRPQTAVKLIGHYSVKTSHFMRLFKFSLFKWLHVQTTWS